MFSETRSESDGRFVLVGLRAGSYTLQAFTEELGEAVVDSVEAGRRDVTVVFEKGISVAGRVLDARDLSPVSDARIRLASYVPARSESPERERGSRDVEGGVMNVWSRLG